MNLGHARKRKGMPLEEASERNACTSEDKEEEEQEDPQDSPGTSQDASYFLSGANSLQADLLRSAKKGGRPKQSKQTTFGELLFPTSASQTGQ